MNNPNEMTILVELEEQSNNAYCLVSKEDCDAMNMIQEFDGVNWRARRRPRKKISNDIFMEVFNKAGSLKEAAQLLGLPVNSVSVKASNLRKTGCNVKRFRRGRKKKVAR